jgi:hypothetical protein
MMARILVFAPSQANRPPLSDPDERKVGYGEIRPKSLLKRPGEMSRITIGVEVKRIRNGKSARLLRSVAQSTPQFDMAQRRLSFVIRRDLSKPS